MNFQTSEANERSWTFLRQTGTSNQLTNTSNNSDDVECPRIRFSMLPWIKQADKTLGKQAGTVTVFFIVSTIWLTTYVLTKGNLQENMELLSLLLLLTTSLGCGLVLRMCRLPSLLGMVLIGLVWNNWNITPVDIPSSLSTTSSGILRNLATVVILLRGGYGLNHLVLRANWPVILSMSILPCGLETLVWGILANVLLNMPWLWGILTGFTISAASAAVVIPMMLTYQEQGLGIEKGLPTIAIASTAIDNVIAMAGFGILQSFIFSTGNLSSNLAKIPIQIIVGISFGVGWGLLISYIPRKDIRQGHLISGRVLLLLNGGIIAVFGSKALDYPGAGPLACVIIGFLANINWKAKSGWGLPQQPNPIGDILSALWIFLEAMLFVLIGTQIAVTKLKVTSIGYGMLVLVIAWLARFLITVLSVTCAGLSWKEKFSLALAWLPKATVQAALGPVALETAIETKADSQTLEFANIILNLAALSILLTAPSGTLAMEICIPRLLRNSSPVTQESNVNDGDHSL